MFGFEIFGAFEIGDRAGDFENPVVATSRKAEFGDGAFHDPFAFGCQHAVLSNVPRAHLGIRVNVFVEEAAELRVPCGDNTVTYGVGRLGGTAAHQVFVWDGRHVNLNVDAIHQRT